MPEITPPESSEVKFFTVNLKLAPAVHEKLSTLQEKTGLTKAKFFSAIIQAGHASLTGKVDLANQWKNYTDQLTAANKKAA